MSAEKKIDEARMSLLVSADSLDFDAVSAALGLEATATRRKGELMNRLPEIIAEQDEWACAVDLNHPHGEDDQLNSLLESMLAHSDAIEALKQTAQVSLRMYVKSDHAQIAYSLMPETLRKLAATGLPLQVSTLSWGEVHL